MSVKVAVRVRPFNEREKNLGASCCISMVGPSTIIKDPSGGDAANKAGERTFAFDYSFWSHDDFNTDEDGYSVAASADSKYADQQLVYEALGKQVLDNAWQGYHCCLFAYGQTGSGKSYSMVGFGTNKGIVPKVCDEIFNRINTNKDTTKYEVEFSMMEIYNEKVQDLMEKDETKKPLGGLQVRQKPSGEVYVQNLSRHAVDSYALIDTKMDQGFTNRSIGATKMNQTSSRAHTIITILFKQINVVEGRKVEKYSAINLVDLAGSEKAGQTEATGQRLKEGCAINKSLTVLGNCISVLADKAMGKQQKTVVPYRDSNLTRILQNALGGNSKTIMICAISPADSNYEESLSTLRYADRAKKIVNKAVINESVQDKIIRELRAQNERLTKILRDAARKGGGVINWKDLDLGDAQDVADQMDHAQQELDNMEKTWEERLQEQREKDESERRRQIQEEQHQQLTNKRAPHLTNLNEDAQLSGKVHYNLAELGKEDVKIGRQDESDTNQIVLRGIGIQQNHAQFKIEPSGQIKMIVRGQEAFESTLVNGQKLQPSRSNFGSRALDGDHDGEPLQEYAVLMNHLDRISLGTGQQQLFMFRYPLQKFVKEKIVKEIQESDQTLEPEEVEAKFEQQIELQGLTKDLTNIVCDEYPESAIHEDDAMTRDCFESAYEEVQQAEEEKQAQVMFEQQQAYDLKMKEMEEAFKKQFDTMQRQQIEAEQRANELYHKQLPAEPQKKEEVVPPPVPVDPKVLEMERKMQELMDQLNKKDESLRQIELENQRKLQEQQEAVEKEKQSKLEYEQQMLMLKNQLSGVKNEFEGHKKLSQQQMEENTRKLQEQMEVEKQRAIQEKEAQERELEAQMAKMSQELQMKDKTLSEVQTDTSKKLQQQLEQIENEKKIKAQVDEQMKKLQQQLVGVQSEYETQKTMSKQQLEEQQQRLQDQFQQEKQKLVDLEKVKELQSQMEQLNSQLQQKDESLKSVQDDTQKKLQEQMQAIKKEQDNKLLTEQKMKELQQQLVGVQSEFEGHKKLSQQQLEEEKRRQQQQLEEEKQKLIQEKLQKEQELQQKMQKLNQELEKKDQTLISVQSDTQKKMQEQMEQINKEKEYKSQVEEQMKKLQAKFVGVQSDFENQKTMSQQQLEEQKQYLLEQFQSEKKKLVEMDQMTALQEQMQTLNEQLQQKDESLRQEQLSTQKKLQEQMDAIHKEKSTKAQVEEQMKKLQEQFVNIQSEYQNQKTMTKQQLEEQQKRLQEQFQQEKQKLVEIDKMKALEDQMQDLNKQLQQKDESLKNVQSENEKKLQEQTEKANQEREFKAQVELQMKQLQQQFLNVQSEYETQKTMTKQQLEEQKQNLLNQFQSEKQKLVELDKMKALENRMTQLTSQLEEKDKSLNEIKSSTENKLLRQSEVINKEKQTREQVEEQKKLLQQQLMGVQSEYQSQKQVSEQMLEEQKKVLEDKQQQEQQQEEQKRFMEQQHAAEKQQLERRIQSLYNKQLPNEPSPSKNVPQAPPVPLDKKSADLEKQMTKLGTELKKKDEELKAQEHAHMWQNMRQRSEIVEATDKHLSSEKEKAQLQIKLQNVQQVKNHQSMLTKQQLEDQEKKLIAKFEKEKQQLEIERRKQTFITQKRNELSDNAKKVKEANDICRILGKDIHLKQILTRFKVDDTGRKTTLIGVDDPTKAKFKEELQIQVTNNDKRGAVTMWSEQKFEDKLIMMRDALVEYEQEQERRRKLKQKEEKKQQQQEDADFSDLRRSSLSAVNEEIFDQQNKEEQVAQNQAELDDMLLNNDIKLEIKDKGEVEDSLDFHKMLEQNLNQDRRETHNPKMPKDIESAPNTVQMNDNIDSFMEQQFKENGLRSTNEQLNDIKNIRKSAKKIQQASKKNNVLAQSTPAVQQNQQQFPNLDNTYGLEAFNMPTKEDSKESQFDFSTPQQEENSMFDDSMFAAFSNTSFKGRDRSQWLNEQMKRQEEKEKEVDPFAHHKQEKFTESYKPLREQDLTNIRQDYKKEESDARMPSYYSKDHVPHQMPKDRQNVEVRQTYLHHLLSKYTPVEVQADLFMKPIPREIGQIQCNIIRDKSGLNKLSPKFLMELSYGKKAMLKAEKLQFSSTAHYKITINSDEAKYLKNKDESYLGRLRGNLGQSQFYIFDKGENPKAAQNNAQPELRKQYGTITYASKDKFGAKEARNIDVYIPQIMTNSGTIKSWVDLPNKKKQFIDKEYELQQTEKMNEFIKKSQDPSMTSMTDINELTSDIMYFKSRNDEGYLDFESTGGIAPKASKKNFQLTDDFDATKVYMQFGRVDDNSFNVELSYPFSIFQAFGICLSTFESKL